MAPVHHDWYTPLGALIAAAGFYTSVNHRIYRPAVTRTATAIICRYTPWREASLYQVLVSLPGIGFLSIHSDTAVVRHAGVMAFAMVPYLAFSYFRHSRRCLLSISPTALTVTVPDHRYATTEIARGAVESITAETRRLRLRRASAAVTQISYAPAGPAPSEPGVVLLGSTDSKNAVWLTVGQADLVAALQTWKHGDPRDPQLLDRIEATLRGAGGPPAGQPTTAPAAGSPHPPTGPPAPALPDPDAADNSLPSPVQPQPPASRPSGRRALIWAVVVVAAVIAINVPGWMQREPPGCPAPGVGPAALRKGSAAEPSIYLALAPGWTDLPDTAATGQEGASVRAHIANPAIREDDFTPFLEVDLTSTTGAESDKDVAERIYAEARDKGMTISSRKVATVCGTTVYQANTSGYNPDGKGAQTGPLVVSMVEGAQGKRWIAVASLKTRNPDNFAYIAQRDDLVAGFHASMP